MKNKNFAGSLLLLVTAFIWGLAFVAQNRAADSVGPYTLNFCRFLIASVFLIPCIAGFDSFGKRRLFDLKNRRVDITKKEFIGGIICGIILALASVLQQAGIGAGSGVSGFITSLYVVLVPVFGLFMGKRTSVKNAVCVLLALVGVFLISYGGGGFSKECILLMLCAVAFSFHIIAVDRLSPGCDGVRLSFIQFITGSVVTLPLMLIFEEPRWSDISGAALPILYIGIMSSGVAYTLQILGQKKTSPTVASVILSLESVFAAIGGVVISHEHLGARQIVGCITVFAAVIVTQISLPTIKMKKSRNETDNGDSET